MSGTTIVARLALRELWITFRLLVIVAAFVTAGAVVALLPAPLAELRERLALALAAAIVVVTALAALAMADERRNGRAGWLVTRSVSRGAILAGWFVAIGLLSVVGVTIAAVLGWLAASTVTVRLELLPFVAAMAGVAATALAAIAVALLVGILLPGRIAAVLAPLAMAVVGAILWFGAWPDGSAVEIIPGAALVALARIEEGGGTAGLWRSTGSALVGAGIALLLARAALERVEL